MSELSYPPPFQDLATLARHICAGESTIEKWVKEGLLPAPKKIGGKRLWRWQEVEKYLTVSSELEASPDPLADRIRHATAQAASATRRNSAR